MRQGFYNWLTDVTDLQIIIGQGNPEGVVEARVATLFMDTLGTSGSILYVKKDREISGDRTQGWVLA